ncbi:MAG: MATE family efflux transporter [Zoogloea sp.]|nr:MATE family efflux transporter [Zoogloea sp.]
MNEAPVSRTELARRIVHIAWPVLVAQLSSMAQMVSDTILAGSYDTEALAAVAIGSGIYIAVVMLLVGILQAVAPVVAHHHGAGRTAEIGPALQQGFWLALLLAVPGLLFLQHPGLLLHLSDITPGVEEKARDYLATIAWGLPAALLYRTFYAFTNALGHTRVLMAIGLAAASIHIPLSWALINGHLGLAPLGGSGCATSSATIAWFALGAGSLHLARNRAYAPYQLFARWHLPRRAALAELLRLGLPIGFSSFVEITAFTLIALFIAGLGAQTVAGHRIVSNLSALTYMLPLSLSIATLVQVGQAAGAHAWERAQTAAWTGMLIATVLSTVLGVILWLTREPVLNAYTGDPGVRSVALGLIVYICVYQFFDAIQTVAAHVLRGYKITFLPMVIHTACFWGVGLAGGYMLANHGWPGGMPLGVTGFWQASVASTILAAILFGSYLLWVVRGKACGS